TYSDKSAHRSTSPSRQAEGAAKAAPGLPLQASPLVPAALPCIGRRLRRGSRSEPTGSRCCRHRVSTCRGGLIISVGKRDPFAVDPAIVERGMRGHAQTQNALAPFARSRGGSPRSPRPDEPNFDLAWELHGVVCVAEVKSITEANEEKQLRLGLGQVLRYRQLLRQRCAHAV